MKVDKELYVDYCIHGTAFYYIRKWFNPLKYIFGDKKRIPPDRIFIKSREVQDDPKRTET